MQKTSNQKRGIIDNILDDELDDTTDVVNY